MEVSSRMISAMVGGGFILGFLIEDLNWCSLKVSHLLFVKDTLIFFFFFSQMEQIQIRSLRALVLCFEAVFGLKVNLSKFELVPAGMSLIFGV